jgi:hypothetical protein
MEVDFITDNLLVKAYERYSFGLNDSRIGVFGTLSRPSIKDELYKRADPVYTSWLELRFSGLEIQGDEI